MGRIREAMAVIGMALVVGVAGCGDGKSDGNGPTGTGSPSVPAPTVSTDPAETEAREQILATYSGYLEAYIAASAKADHRTGELAKWVAEPLLGQLINNLYNMSRSDLRNVGRPEWNPVVTELRLDADQAVIEDCFDASGWDTVGGKAPATPQAKKYPVVAKVKRVNGRWYVYESTPQRSSSC